MSKGKQTSSKDKAKVIEAKVNNPDLSTRDIQEKTGVEYSTASRILKNDLQQVATQSNFISSIIDTNKNIMSLANKYIQEKIKSEQGNLNMNDLKIASELAFKQNEIFGLSDDTKKELTVKFEI